jgi:protein TonB
MSAAAPLLADPAPTRAAAAGRGAGAEVRDGLSPGQLRAVVAGVVALHAAAGWGLLQVAAVREVLAESAPVFVRLLDVPAPAPLPERAPPPAPPPRVTSPAASPAPVLPPPVRIAAAPTPAPAPWVAPRPEPEAPPVAPAAPPAPAPAAPAPPPAAAPAPAPSPAPPAAPAPAAVRSIPPSAVQYLEPPAPTYPRTSIRLHETGVVTVRVFIGEDGLPRQVQLARSSGFPRLDESAVSAVQKARFRPPTENGQPLSGWARIDIPFELEK